MDINNLYKKITSELEEKAICKFKSKEEYLNWSQKVYDDQGYRFYKLSVPEIDTIVKKYINQFNVLSFDERLDLAKKFYKSGYIGQTSFGLKLLELSLTELTPKNFDYIDNIVSNFTGWGPTDSFSLYIMQPLLNKYPIEVKRLLEKWNRSQHLWKKRASVVVFTRKVGASGEYIDYLLKLCDNLIWDKEDLVRKAVGWALKDNMIGKNKEKVLKYVKKLREMGVSSTITLYAIRKLKGKEREEILKIKPKKIENKII
ncbi:MAG: DNA alkylation repair protein [Candidatus Hermodarchaeota archaeon]